MCELYDTRYSRPDLPVVLKTRVFLQDPLEVDLVKWR